MKSIRVVALVCLLGLAPTAAIAQTIVWTDQDAKRIQRKDVTGGDVTTIVQFASNQNAYTIHYDPITAKLYYLFYGPPISFQRANLDGSNPQNIPTPSWGGGFTLNVALRKLYWIKPGNVVNRSELDGTGLHTHTYPTGSLLTLEAVGEDLFFGAGGVMAKGVWRADADGSKEQFLHTTSQPIDLAYDPVENKVYCAGIDAIFRMNPDGSGFQVVVFLPAWQQLNSGPDHVVVDSRTRKLYWADRTAKVIQRSNLDGSNTEDFVTASDVDNPSLDISGLTIVYSSQPIPTLSSWGLVAMGAVLIGIGVVVIKKRPNSQSMAS